MVDYHVPTQNGSFEVSSEDDDDPDERTQKLLLKKTARRNRRSNGEKKPTLKGHTKRASNGRNWQVPVASLVPVIERQYLNPLDSMQHLFVRSKLNILLIFVPFGIAAHLAGLKNPTVDFALNAIAILPLTAILTYSTENVALNLGNGPGALLNIVFGNLVELVILIFMLRKNHVKLVKQSLLGSIFVNLLFILGIAMMSAGLKTQEAVYDTRRTQILMFFTVTGILCLLIPTSLRACIAKTSLADAVTLKFSRGLSIALLVAYIMFVHFQIRSQPTPLPPSSADLEMSPYHSTTATDNEDDNTSSSSSATLQPIHLKKRTRPAKKDKEIHMHRFVSLAALLISAGVVSITAEFMVSSIEAVISDAPLTEAFLGLIILPLLGNVAELATSISVSSRGNIDLAINVTVGSAIQVSTFMAPFMVLLAWGMGRQLSLYFDMFQTVTLCGTMVLVAVMLIAGRSHYLLGMLLCIAYVVIGIGAFFMPNQKGTRIHPF